VRALVEDGLIVSRRFTEWWFGELAGLVPERFRSWFSPASEAVVVLLPADPGRTASAKVLYEVGRRKPARLLGIVDLGEGAVSPHEAFRMLLRRSGVARAVTAGRLPLCVRLPATRALRTVATLPLAAESNLGEVVSYELERLTPFRAEQVYVAHRVIERNAAEKSLTVELTIVPRSFIEDDVATVCRRLGMTPNRIEAAGDGAGADAAPPPPSGKLVPADGAGASAQRSSSPRLTVLLAGAAAVLAAAAIYLPIATMQQEADELDGRLAAAKRSGTELAALQREIDAAREEESFLIDHKRQVPTVSEILREVTHLLPDDTWLSELQIANGEVQITGSAASASSLIARLEGSNLFRDSNFRSPVTQDVKSDRERFQIGARLIPPEAPR
jgi:general secretion pathway protein L